MYSERGSFHSLYPQVYRHSKNSIKTGYQTFKHEHDPQLRKRDYKRYFNQKKVGVTSSVSLATCILNRKLPLKRQGAVARIQVVHTL